MTTPTFTDQQYKDLNFHSTALDQSYTESLRTNIELRKQILQLNTTNSELNIKIFEFAKQVNELKTKYEPVTEVTETTAVADIA